MTTRIKICGITRQDDADAVVLTGAHALGLNFAPESPRCLDPARARRIADQVRGAVTRVGVFVNPTADDVARVLEAVDLDALQFHGDESGELCRSFGLPYLKVIRVPWERPRARAARDGRTSLAPGGDLSESRDREVAPTRRAVDMARFETVYGDACCLMLDTFVEGMAGGTGVRFDWSVWPQQARLPLVLAGGLTPHNVGEAVRSLAPWGVDVSGGVEGPVKGEKDPARIRRFVEEVQRARS